MRALTIGSVGALLAALPLLAQGPPTFRSAVDVIAVDVQVVDKNGAPVATLGPAQFSVTIDGIRHVVDSGQARVARYDAHRGINTLLIEKISRAAADQRAGRAGRTAPGVCLRLWTEREHRERPAGDRPGPRTGEEHAPGEEADHQRLDDPAPSPLPQAEGGSAG